MIVGPRFNHNTYPFNVSDNQLTAHERMINGYRFTFSRLTRADGTVTYLVTKNGHGYLNTYTHAIRR